MRRLNEEGIRRMEAFLDSLTTESPTSRPDAILTSPSTSEGLSAHIPVDQPSFRSRFELAEYVYERFRGCGLNEPDEGTWEWLALFWFDQLCPSGSDGRRRPGERARWIKTTIGAGARYYRHLVYSPYILYLNNVDDPERLRALLCDPVHTIGRLYYQLTSRRSLITCPTVVELTRKLYYDERRGRLRRGAQSIDTPASVFRLVDVLLQFDRTYDLHMISVDHLLALLPREFDRFRMEVPLGERTPLGTR